MERVSSSAAEAVEQLPYLPAVSRPTLGIAREWRRVRPLDSLASYRIGKRAVDVILAVALLPVILAAGVVCAILIKLNSRGPLFYRHRRIGYRGRTFYMWKFRTMRMDGDRILREYFEQHPDALLEWKRCHKLKNDPRVTSLGQFLRMSSLDELPQILNVLNGEMSLVGPRPIVDEEVEKYADRFEYFIASKPGVTGLWQVSGRSEVNYEDRTALDQRYVEEWSHRLDAKILLKTFRCVWHREGAY